MQKCEKLKLLVLCGGQGSRLKTISGKRPKSLVSIGHKSLLEVVISNIWEQISVEDTFLLTGYKHSAIISEFNKNVELTNKVKFIQELQPLGTGGAVLNALSKLEGEYFLVVNGDTIINADIGSFIQDALTASPDISLLAIPAKSSVEYGSISFDQNGNFLSFSEKTSVGSNYVNSGMYVISKSTISSVGTEIERLGSGDMISLEYDILTNQKLKISVFKDDDGEFLDVGTPERYQLATRRYSS